jgi:O-acetyl-ADP-ribose deacetylase (regulator of RNase III)
MPEIQERKGIMPRGIIFHKGEVVPKAMPVNTAGKLDSAMQPWAKANPYAAHLYQKFCSRGKIHIGQAFRLDAGGQSWVLLPTRSDPTVAADLETIEAAISSLVVMAAEQRWHTLAIPSLGDDISWYTTRKMLDQLLAVSTIAQVFLYDAPRIRLEVVEHGDILETGNHFAIVIPVSSSGHANKGLARRCAKKYPDWEAAYSEACANGMLRRAGYTYYWTRFTAPTESRLPRKIIAAATVAATKNTPKKPALALCISLLQDYSLHTPRMTDIAIPAVHSGFAGIAWPRVKDVIEDSLESWAETLETVYLYPPYP